MRRFLQFVAALTIGLCFTASAFSQAAKAASNPPGTTAAARAEAEAMTPGAAHRDLRLLVGTFNAAGKTWTEPSGPPSEFVGTSINTMVLGDRFLQLMLAAVSQGEIISAIDYVGYDNVLKKFVMTAMDSGSTSMEWYTGTTDATGTNWTFNGTVADPVTGKPSPVEVKVTVANAGGGFVSQVWGPGPDGKMFRMMEIQYTRR